jgi:hypothetical protein
MRQILKIACCQLGVKPNFLRAHERKSFSSKSRETGRIDFKHRLSYVELTEQYVLEYISVYG